MLRVKVPAGFVERVDREMPRETDYFHDRYGDTVTQANVMAAVHACDLTDQGARWHETQKPYGFENFFAHLEKLDDRLLAAVLTNREVAGRLDRFMRRWAKGKWLERATALVARARAVDGVQLEWDRDVLYTGDARTGYRSVVAPPPVEPMMAIVYEEALAQFAGGLREAAERLDAKDA